MNTLQPTIEEAREEIARLAKLSNKYQIQANVNQILADEAADNAEKLAEQYDLVVEWFGCIGFEIMETKDGEIVW